MNRSHQLSSSSIGLSVSVLLAAGTAGLLIATGNLALLAIPTLLAASIFIVEHPQSGIYALAFLMPLQYLTRLQNQATAIRYVGWLVFAAWILGKAVHQASLRPILDTPLSRAVAFYLLWCFVSVLWSPFGAWRALFFTFVQLAAMVVLFIDLVDSKGRLEVLLLYLLVGTVIGAGVAIHEYITVLPSRQVWSRALGGYGDGNYSSASYMFALPFALFLINNRPGWKRVLGLLSVPMLLTGVAVTASRVGLLSVPLWIILQLRKPTGRRGQRLQMLFVLGLTLATALLWPWDTIQYRFAAAWSGGEPQDLGGRVRIFSLALEKLAESPIIGHGMGSPLGVSEHNLFLQIAVRLGLVGLLAMCNILFLIWRSLSVAQASARHHGDTELAALARTVRDGVVIYLFFSLALNTATSRLLWLTFALSHIVLQVSVNRKPSGASLDSCAPTTQELSQPR